MKILVTGANGFIGKALCSYLENQHHSVVRAVRNAKDNTETEIGFINADTDWSLPLGGCDYVVHLAARVHKKDQGNFDVYKQVNSDAAINLAMQANSCGVKRFIFISSVSIYGHERSQAYKEDDPHNAVSAYGKSKAHAEDALYAYCKNTNMEITILRPPMVYGPEVGANFLKLLNLVRTGAPLPFAGIHNKRSLLYIGNLIDAVEVCLTHQNAANRTFNVSDLEDYSTEELVRQIASIMGKSERLFYMPTSLLYTLARIIRKEDVARKLLGSFRIDCSLIKQELGWHPPYSIIKGIEASVSWYVKNKQ